jgi:hypothetical protein
MVVAMQPVNVFRLPHNYRDPLYDKGEAPETFCDETGEPRPPPFGSDFVDLPIRMPSCLIIHTDHDGRPIAVWADGARIRWKDIDCVVLAAEQYNRHLAEMGITAPPPPPTAPEDAEPDDPGPSAS